jgi:hypothetical protein
MLKLFKRNKDTEKTKDVELLLLRELIIRLYNVFQNPSLTTVELIITAIAGILGGLGVGALLSQILKPYIKPVTPPPTPTPEKTLPLPSGG